MSGPTAIPLTALVSGTVPSGGPTAQHDWPRVVHQIGQQNIRRVSVDPNIMRLLAYPIVACIDMASRPRPASAHRPP